MNMKSARIRFAAAVAFTSSGSGPWLQWPYYSSVRPPEAIVRPVACDRPGRAECIWRADERVPVDNISLYTHLMRLSSRVQLQMRRPFGQVDTGHQAMFLPKHCSGLEHEHRARRSSTQFDSPRLSAAHDSSPQRSGRRSRASP